MQRLIELCERLDTLRAGRKGKKYDEVVSEIVDTVSLNRDLLRDVSLFLRSAEVVIAMTGSDDEEPEHSAADVFEAVCNLGAVPDLSEL